jgi:hypothetical protein
MFQRGIGLGAVLAVVARGETVATYADDTLHVVVALDESTGACIVVTAYEPAIEQWGADFRTRKNQ